MTKGELIEKPKDVPDDYECIIEHKYIKDFDSMIHSSSGIQDIHISNIFHQVSIV